MSDLKDKAFDVGDGLRDQMVVNLEDAEAAVEQLQARVRERARRRVRQEVLNGA